MKHNRLFPFIAILIAVSMILSACGPLLSYRYG